MDSLLAKRRILVGAPSIKRVHDLKLAADFLQNVVNNVRTFDIRNNDRRFQIHDDLLLRSLHLDDGVPTYDGGWAFCHVKYILDDEQWGMRPGYVVMAITCIISGHDNEWKSYPAIRNHIVDYKP